MIVILDNLRSALNVGSIIRTAEAFGTREIYFCGITPDATNPKVKKTSLGAEKAISSQNFPETASAIQSARESGHTIIGLEIASGSTPLRSAKARDKDIALVVGNEVSGITPNILALCDKIVEIPMKGTKESLNVAVAAGIAAYVLSKK